MEALNDLEITDGIAIHRPVGEVTLPQAVQSVVSAIASAREQNIHKLLTVLTGLTGFASPSVAARYQLVKDGAAASGGMVRVAMVIRPEMFDPQKIGVLVGRHIGLVCDVFTSEPEAMAWLRGLP
jgi:hypothetical protein